MVLPSCGDQQTLKAPKRPPTDSPNTTQIAGNAGDPERGEALFRGETPDVPAGFVACTTCHYTDPDQGILVGPNMSGVANRAGERIADTSAESYLRDSIMVHDDFLVPGFDEGVMISIVGDDFEHILPEEEIDHLVAYLMTLDGPESPDQILAESLADDASGMTVEEAMGKESDTTAEAEMATETIVLGKPAQECIANDNGFIVTNDEQFSFQPPPGWHTLSFSGTIATHPQAASRKHGPVIAMMDGTLEELNIPNESTGKITSTEAFFPIMIQNLHDEMFALTITDEETGEIGGYPAYIANITGSGFGDIEEPFAGRVAMALLAQDRVFVMMGIASPAEQWEQESRFDELLGSITFDDTIQTSGAPSVSGGGHPANAASQGTDEEVILAIMAKVHHGGVSMPSMAELDRDTGPRFACVQCHVTHDVEMLHDSNPSCNSCHSGTPYQRHCVDCHSIHDVHIPHDPDNPSCASCHPAGIPGKGIDVQQTLVAFLSYLFHEV
jgi:hypothetical protein